MRTPTTLLTLSILGLVFGAAAGAFAQAPEDPGADRRASAEEKRAAAQERRAELLSAREAVLAAFKANRSAILAEYQESLNATRASFLAAKAEVLAACNETRAASTNSSETRGAPEHAKCVSDGLKPLIEKARAEMSAAREEAHAKLVAERAHGMSAWAKARERANERYHARTGETPAGA